MERFYKRIKKTVEDARNATIQKIRAIIPRLEESRKVIADELVKVSNMLKIAISKLSLEEYHRLAESVRPTVEVDFAEVTMEGLKFTGIDFKGVTCPNYGIFSIPPELDSAIYGLYANFKVLAEVLNLESLFYTLLARVREYQRMVNAIDNVILPRIADNIQFVKLKLDEGEREEFIRRKIISMILESR